jgi:hypothetical protein
MQQRGWFAQTWVTQSDKPSQPSESFAPVVHALWAQDPNWGPSHAEHDELMQVLPPPHAFPQVPQLAPSVLVSLQLPPQQVVPPVHALPHDPQFALSFEVSTQTLLHAVWLPLQPTVHLPATQLQVLFPPWQTLPHDPQFFASVWVSTQALVQTSPFGHAHWPLVHVAPVAHLLPQLPQFSGLVCVLPQPTAPSGGSLTSKLASMPTPPS